MVKQNGASVSKLHWINGPWRGRAAIAECPRGGDLLGSDVTGWHQAGIHAVASLLTAEEVAELDLTGETQMCRERLIRFFPLAIPRDAVAPGGQTVFVLRSLLQDLERSRGVAIHCAGDGRSAMIAAGLLVLAGVRTAEAFDRIQAARGAPVLVNDAQRNWVEWMAHTPIRT